MQKLNGFQGLSRPLQEDKRRAGQVLVLYPGYYVIKRKQSPALDVQCAQSDVQM